MAKRKDILPLPSQDILLRLFHYDPETGALTWSPKIGTTRGELRFNTMYAGKTAGVISKYSHYWTVGFRIEPLGRAYRYYSHRVIWKMVTGEDPPDQIDHKDGDKQNNKWLNLRPADNGKNIFNSKLRSDNTSGFKGVHLRTNDGSYRKYRAVITANGKSHRLGDYDTPEEADAARRFAAVRLHGEFARLE